MPDVKLGFTDRTETVFIPDPASTDGSGKTGLVAANLTVSYTRVETDNDVIVTDVTSSLNDLSALTDAHNDWGLKEVSSTLAPGLYRLDIADAVFASGAWSAVVYVMITTSAAAASPMRFALVAFDSLDGVRYGLTALPSAAAGANGGLPTGDASGRVDVGKWLGTAAATPATAGIPDVNAKNWNNLATVDLPLAPTTAGRKLDVSTGGEAGIDWANVGSPTTSLALTGTTIAVTQKVDVDTIKTNPVVNAGTITFPTTATLASTTNITAGTVTTATNVTTVNGLAAGVITATSIAADAITDAKVAADVTIASVTGAVGSVTGAVGSVTGNVGGNVVGSIGSLATQAKADVNAEADTAIADAALATAANLALVKADTAAVKLKTDNLTFTSGTDLDVNVQKINDVALLGDGSATPWGPV